MNLPLPFPLTTPVDSSSHPKGQGEDERHGEEEIHEVVTPTHADSREVDNPTPHEFPDLEVETECTLLAPGLSNGGELQLVAYGSAQATTGDTVHFQSLRPQHYLVRINSYVAGFENIPLPVPIVDDGITLLWEAKGSYVQWPRAWVRLINEISKKSQPSKRRKVEKPKSVDQPTKKMSEQGSKSEQVWKKNSSKGSAMQPTPLVGDNVLQSLTKDLTFLHNRFSHLPSDDSIEIALPKAMFHYDEDASAWLNKQVVKEFLRGLMLNISLIQIFMREIMAPPTQKTSMLRSKREYVPPLMLARGRGKRLANIYSPKSPHLQLRVGNDSPIHKGSADRNLLQSRKPPLGQFKTVRNSAVVNSVDNITSFDPLFGPPVHLNCNNRDDQESSFEASDQNFHDDGLHYQSEDEDMHYEQGYEDNNDHGQDSGGNNNEADNENDVEVSPTMQEDVDVESGDPSTSKKKNDSEKRRGRNKCKEIAKLKPNEKLQIEFFNNRAVGKNHKVFARHLGIIVRNTNICPVRVHKWNDIGEREKEHMWATVTDVFANENMETYKDHILEHMKELWRKWRSDLLRYNVTKKKITLAAAYKGKPPNGLDMNEWKWLIKEIYMKDDFKKRSARNSENRGYYAKELMPRTGSKPFRQVIWDDLGANKGNEPTLVDVFYSTRKKGTELPNVETTQKLNEIRETMEKDPSLSHAEIAQKVFKSKSRE
ncbi:uncharacterized protein LOC110724166 isoform X2 [Chenopodium quinoa]|uniref:uncharacterized protein LOC110724166 isoform X2 n=1 Tax=Chenopodium quinoa TaxID=63459 RepID=UPI000B780BCE|nr:uncharacterized protein LOC110724166 isoform X2 [Chenopodium quinoa]